jgi:hypothetical protein
MNDPKGFKSEALGLTQVLFYNSLHIAWRNTVKIQHIRNRDADRLGKLIISRIERHKGWP